MEFYGPVSGGYAKNHILVPFTCGTCNTARFKYLCKAVVPGIHHQDSAYWKIPCYSHTARPFLGSFSLRSNKFKIMASNRLDDGSNRLKGAYLDGFPTAHYIVAYLDHMMNFVVAFSI